MILTTFKDYDRHHPKIPDEISVLRVDPSKHNLEQIVFLICQHIRDVKKVHTLIIAIDPGEEKTGVALFVNKKVIYSRELLNLKQLGSFLRDVFGLYPDVKKSLKIGEGNFFLAMNILDYFKKDKIINETVEIQLIDEYRTSNKTSFSKNKLKKIIKTKRTIHEKSAILIGQRRGKRFFLKNDGEENESEEKDN